MVVVHGSSSVLTIRSHLLAWWETQLRSLSPADVSTRRPWPPTDSLPLAEHPEYGDYFQQLREGKEASKVKHWMKRASPQAAVLGYFSDRVVPM